MAKPKREAINRQIKRLREQAEYCRGMAEAAWGVGARLDGDAYSRMASWNLQEARKLEDGLKAG